MKFSITSQTLFSVSSLFTSSSVNAFGILPERIHYATVSSDLSLTTTTTTTTALHATAGDDPNAPRRSFLEGNRREPTIQEIATMDEMITKLLDAKPYELPNAVSQAIRVISSPRFFMRIAERADMESSKQKKEQLAALADNLVSTLDAVTSVAEDKLDERAKDVERVLKAAAEPGSGEFLVPLSAERLDAMRAELTTGLDPASLDEGFLTTVDAWMNKSSKDGMDGMVVILQKVLQMYAGTAVSRARSSGESGENGGDASSFLEKLLAMDTDEWDAELATVFQNNDVTPSGIMGEVQRTIEGVVLGLENGSMAQRVQAEYLRELVARIETTQKNLGL